MQHDIKKIFEMNFNVIYFFDSVHPNSQKPCKPNLLAIFEIFPMIFKSFNLDNIWTLKPCSKS